MDKLVIFGPWVGEFSYETNWWIPEIRLVKKTYYNDYKCIAVSSKGREILYSDFVDEFIYYTDDLESQRKYPATYGEHINGRDIIPENFQNFIDEIVRKHQDQYDVYHYKPGQFPIDSSRTFSDNPFGEFINYTASSIVKDEISEQIKFDNIKDTISILARLKDRENTGVLAKKAKVTAPVPPQILQVVFCKTAICFSTAVLPSIITSFILSLYFL